MRNNASLSSTVDLEGENLHGEGAKRLASSLAHNSTITRLCLRHCYVHDSDMTELAAALWRNRHRIVALDLKDNFISHQGVGPIADALLQQVTGETSLRYFRLDSNGVGDVGASALASALRSNRTLQSLGLGDNGIGTLGALDLCDALKMNAAIPLARLDLSRNEGLDDRGIEIVASYLKHSRYLTRLGLSRVKMGDEGATAIADALRSNSSIAKIDLSHNKITKDGATEIASALETNCSLRSINLCHNNISDDGASNIAFCLFRNEFLMTLDLKDCGICSVGASCLAIALQKNYAVQKLYLGENMEISNSIQMFIDEALGKNGNPTSQKKKKARFCLTREKVEDMPSLPKKRLLFVLWIAQKIDAGRIANYVQPLGADIWWTILGILCGSDLVHTVPNAIDSWPQIFDYQYCHHF